MERHTNVDKMAQAAPGSTLYIKWFLISPMKITGLIHFSFKTASSLKALQYALYLFIKKKKKKKITPIAKKSSGHIMDVQ